MAITKKLCPVCKIKHRHLYMLPSHNRVYYYNVCHKCYRELVGSRPNGQLCAGGSHPN
jgi:hypothetical protein